MIDHETKLMVERTIERMDHVRDSAIVRRGTTISIAVVVDYAVNPETSRLIGDNAVRMAKSMLFAGGEKAPGKAIGKGLYTYQIGVYRPNEDEVAVGTKDHDDDRIRWWSGTKRGLMKLLNHFVG